MLNLIGDHINLDVSTAIGPKSIPSHMYKVPLIDDSNVWHIITAFQVKNLSGSIHDVDISGVKCNFLPNVQR